jgi:TetR/AcrR family transcriptional regulator, transcriptional repressor for nem operon
MSRPREFDHTEVLHKIADVFIANGYNGTSVSMLTEASGLGRQSLYNAFGDKQSLYLKAIECATERHHPVCDSMCNTSSGYEAIELLFRATLDGCTSGDRTQSCIVSAGLLEGIEEEAIGSKLKECWGGTQHLLETSVRRGQKDGSIRSDQSAKDLANLMMALMSGARVSARALTDKASMKRIIQLALSMLRPA